MSEVNLLHYCNKPFLPSLINYVLSRFAQLIEHYIIIIARKMMS